MKAHISQVIFSEDTKKKGSELYALKKKFRDKSNISKREEIRQNIIDFLNKTTMTEMEAISGYIKCLDPNAAFDDYKEFTKSFEDYEEFAKAINT